MMLNIEELNLLIIFDCSSRKTAALDIKSHMLRIEDLELREMSKVLLSKLECMTDEEYAQIDFELLKEDGAYGKDD